MEIISSLQNPKIKNLQKLQKPQERREQGVFIVEGLKEINMAIDGGYEPYQLFYFPLKMELLKDFLSKFTVFEISKDIFEKIAYREGSDGLIATFKQRFLTFDQLTLRKNPLILAVEAIEKPGNLGAILRTADASQVDAVLVCDPRTDIFNPNVIRSSVGCLFNVQVVTCTNEQALHWLKQHQINTYAAALSNEAVPYHTINYKQSSCIVFGTEADGLSEFWMKQAQKKVIIPMLGVNDSLNVSVSTAVIAFEAMRQRNFILE